MDSVTLYREYAEDCVRQAQNETTAEEKSIVLNVALAWLRLAQQSEELEQQAVLALEPRYERAQYASEI